MSEVSDMQNKHEMDQIEYVTVHIGEQLFGLPIGRVHDVFVPDTMTNVPLSAQEIEGVLNLRGRIVTAINMHALLGLNAREHTTKKMAVGVEARGESFGLLIDSVGEVLKLSTHSLEANPVNLDPRLSRVSCGVYRLEGQLMVVLDVDKVLSFDAVAVAA
jgi:purine-binding chemotaxis protein CheW